MSAGKKGRAVLRLKAARDKLLRAATAMDELQLWYDIFTPVAAKAVLLRFAAVVDDQEKRVEEAKP